MTIEMERCIDRVIDEIQEANYISYEIDYIRIMYNTRATALSYHDVSTLLSTSLSLMQIF